MACPPNNEKPVSNETLVLMEGFVNIIDMVFPSKGRKDLSPDFSNAFTSMARSNIFKIVSLSKSSM